MGPFEIILIVLCVLFVLFVIVKSTIDRKKGKTSCGCGCGCSNCKGCSSKNTQNSSKTAE